ncbi:hypothetical protein ABIA99_007757 [Bradyrhizobium sp. LB12.1]|uniref:hypothetical protein n=1 Tax=Bradyrhizobium sp. LB12.1 TaxID=3156327 RepID=UPI0033949D81
MSWCDRLASTPGVGFQLTPYFASFEVIRAWGPLLNSMVDGFNNPTFTVTEIQNGYSVTTQDGFIYSADHIRSGVMFAHRLKAKPTSGGPPVMEMLSTPHPFTQLLPEVSSKLIESTRMLPDIASRKISQFGIVSTTRASLDDLPPGLVRFIDYLSRPWGKVVDAFSVEVVSEIDESEHWTDRCQHKIARPQDPDELMSITLDFHRKFKVGQVASEGQMRTIISKCSESALAYLERLAEGNMFDEHIIGRKAG